jgi:hypothetical protein
MSGGYEGTIRLAMENRYYRGMFGGQYDWLEVVKACYEVAGRVDEFAGAWIANKIGWFPSLRKLVKYGILEKRGETVRRGSRAYYAMPDRSGVERALRELGILL